MFQYIERNRPSNPQLLLPSKGGLNHKRFPSTNPRVAGPILSQISAKINLIYDNCPYFPRDVPVISCILPIFKWAKQIHGPLGIRTLQGLFALGSLGRAVRIQTEQPVFEVWQPLERQKFVKFILISRLPPQNP